MPTQSVSRGSDEDSRPKKTGTFWTVSAHISLAMLTPVVAPLVLSVALDIAHLGWIAGPAAICLISLACYCTSRFLCDCYRTDLPASGHDKPKYTYADAIRSSGIPNSEVKAKACAFIQYLTLFGRAINATVGSSVSMMAIKLMTCIHEINGEGECSIVGNPYAIIVGITEILLSQIPDFDGTWWVSIVSVVMFFTYSLIGLGLAIARIAAGGSDESNEAVTGTQKMWMRFQALGHIASACSFSEILIEIQDTIGSSSNSKTMNNATLLSTLVMTTLFMLWGCVGYAAFGDNTPEFPGIHLYGPFWLIYITNAAVLINIVGGYRIYSQPIFAFVEEQAAKWSWTTRDREIPLPGLGHYKMNLFRLVWRTVFVILTTVISLAFPVFNDVVEIITLGFWPLAVYFPVEMYIKKNIDGRNFKWVCLQMLSMACLVISIIVTVASIAELKDYLKDYRPFKMIY